MKVLLIGHGGREHAIARSLAKSSKLSSLYSTGSNPGINKIATPLFPTIPIERTAQLECVDLCVKNSIDLVVVGPEAPLAAGLADLLSNRGIKVFGVNSNSSRLESSKEFAKQFMKRCGIPTADYAVFADNRGVISYVQKKNTYPIVIKADGLAAGKGVVIAESETDVENGLIFLDSLGEAANFIIVEDFLKGWELSVLALCDGETYRIIGYSQDHKRLLDGDKGPNTGGMGAYSPVPQVTDELKQKIEDRVFKPLVESFVEDNIDYRGVVYAGVMVSNNEPYILEFNVRFGDPEAQVILTQLQTDLLELLDLTANKQLKQTQIQFNKNSAVSVVLASANYPHGSTTSTEISGIEEAETDDCSVLHAGTMYDNGKMYAVGGRVLNVVGTGQDLMQAHANAYQGISKIKFHGMQYRLDIAKQAIQYLGK